MTPTVVDHSYCLTRRVVYIPWKTSRRILSSEIIVLLKNTYILFLHKVQRTREEVACRFSVLVFFSIAFHLRPSKGILSFWSGFKETGESAVIEAPCLPIKNWWGKSLLHAVFESDDSCATALMVAQQHKAFLGCCGKKYVCHRNNSSPALFDEC